MRIAIGSDHHDLTIPGAAHGFSTLKAAQAQSDLETLHAGGPPGHPPPPRRQGRAGPAGALADHAHGDAAALRARSPDGKHVCGRVLCPRDLRRLRRPDAPEARARALVDVPGARPARALRGGRRRAHPDGQRAVPHAHAPGDHRLRARPAAVAPRVGPLRAGPLLLCRRPRRRRDLPRPRRLRARRRARARHGRQPALLRVDSPVALPAPGREARRGGAEPRAGGHARAGCASSSRSRSGAIWPPRGRSTRSWPRRGPRTRSTGSTTTSGRRPSRTSSFSAGPMASSSPCGTETTSTTCRSRSARASASSRAARTTRSPARCAT